MHSTKNAKNKERRYAMVTFQSRSILWVTQIITAITTASLSIHNLSIHNCSKCNNEIAICNDNSECLLFANEFDSYSLNQTQLSWTQSYQWYLRYCTVNGDKYNQYGYDCKSNGFFNYFNCTVLNKGCYTNFTYSSCDTHLTNCWNDDSLYDNCWIWLEYMGDFIDSNIFNDQWLYNILIEERVWNFTTQNSNRLNEYILFTTLTTCLYDEIILSDDGSSCSNDTESQCTLNSCIQQQNIMQCMFDMKCGYPLLYFNGGNDIIGIPNYINNCENRKICTNNDVKQTIFDEDYIQFRSIFNNFTSVFNTKLYPKITECSIPNIALIGDETYDDNICINTQCLSELSNCNSDFWQYIDLIPDVDTSSFCNDTEFCPGQCSFDFSVISNVQRKYGV